MDKLFSGIGSFLPLSFVLHVNYRWAFKTWIDFSMLNICHSECKSNKLLSGWLCLKLLRTVFGLNVLDHWMSFETAQETAAEKTRFFFSFRHQMHLACRECATLAHPFWWSTVKSYQNQV